MEQEDALARLNQDFFLREFTYSNSKFCSVSGQELELCDGAIWLDDILILFQAKQRNPADATESSDIESKWFSRKVSKDAVRQLADSVKYLRTEDSLPLLNRRGQELNFSRISPSTIYSDTHAFKINWLHLEGEWSPDEKLDVS